MILPKVNYDWTMLRLQDFKSIGEYNHVVHKIRVRLRFCEKEPFEADKIEKTLQTIRHGHGEHDYGVPLQRCVWRPQIGSFISSIDICYLWVYIIIIL
jgi:hypothetical protein